MTIFVSQAAKIYAQALSELEIDSEVIINDLKEIGTILKHSEDLRKVLTNSSVNFIHKKEIIEEIFKNKINEKLINFLLIIIEKNKISLFDEIFNAYIQYSAKKNGVQTVEVTSAIDLNNDYKTEIKNKLEEKLHKNVLVQWCVSPEIIGGLIYKINDTIIDSSLKNKIENFSKLMK